MAGTSKVRIERNTIRLDDAGFGTDATFECLTQGERPR